MTSTLKMPQCNDCYIKFRNNDDMNLHMNKVHHETDHMRMDRITSAIKLSNINPQKKAEHTKIFDCTECGELFNSSDEQDKHIKEKHMVLERRNMEIKEDNETASAAEVIQENDLANSSESDEGDETDHEQYTEKAWGLDNANRRPGSYMLTGKSTKF